MFLHGYNDNTLELCFGSQDKNRSFINKLMKNTNTVSDNGIEGLSKIANSGKITPEIIQNYTHVVYRNRLEILYGYRHMQEISAKEEYLKTVEFYKDIIQNASKYYDMVLVDLDKRLNNDIAKKILKLSDVLVYNVEQKMDMIKEFLKIREELDTQSKSKMVLNVGRFDENSKYTIKNISRFTGVRRDLSVIPYNTLFFEAASEEKVADLFLKIINVSESDKNAKFIKQVKETVEKIIYKMQEVQMKN